MTARPEGQGIGGKLVANTYDAISRRYSALPLEGCTEGQRAQAKMLVRATHEIAETAARLPPADGERGPIAELKDYREFAAELEGFEKRRQVMQQDLDRMRAVRLKRAG